MLDFNEELEKYKPVLTVDEVENSMSSNEVKDIMDLLQYITKKIGNNQ